MNEQDIDKPEEDASPQEGGLSEDWLATLVGLSILALALLGLVPQGLLW
jgi:hypothetical protein